MKSGTDKFWDDRAKTESSDARVNIADLVQRDLENRFILPLLPKYGKILEVGCGNGFLTEELRKHAEFVDGFDYAENMIERAKKTVGEKNNRFFHDNVLSPKNCQPPYEAIVCVRVLINLRNLDEQRKAVANLASLLQTGKFLILVEGFADGFDSLNKLRKDSGVEPLKPAAINFYSRLEELMPVLSQHFIFTERRFHTGFFDVLTRVGYPLLVGADKASGPADFHEKMLPLLRQVNPDDFLPYARLRGFHLLRR